ncbi:MAG TPA: beta-galactosidase [Rhodanobacteraceae bacterium]
MSVLTPLAASLAGYGMEAVAQGPKASSMSTAEPDAHPHKFGFARQQFMLDGQVFQIRSGQMDPIRIPREHWRQRIRMAKAMGLNTIALYVMWNALESEPGKFDLDTGRCDFAHFIDLCAAEGMWVYLRPGPYVCAEWDFGGLPTYLLRDPSMRIRDGKDKRYMAAVARYMDAVAPRIKSRMVANGGPILMVQVENEYASFGKDLAYLETLQKMWRARGIEGPFSLSDGLGQIEHTKTYIPGTALGLDGGTHFAKAQLIAGEAPVWVGEGYTGWLSHWGDKDFQTSHYSTTLRELMDAGRSFNLYEVHGGTSFGFGAGANAAADGDSFGADLTSYDYGAPINERGVATGEYHRLRAIIFGVLGRAPVAMPEPPVAIEFGAVTPTPWASVWDNLPAPREVKHPQANELLFHQPHGLVLYRKRVEVAKAGTLDLPGVHDYATVFADGKLVGTVSRVQAKGVPEGHAVEVPAGTRQLDILVDCFGHVGYGHYTHDYKGLVEDVRLDGAVLEGWQVYSLPLASGDVARLKPTADASRQPGVFFRARVDLASPADCFVDMSAWHKGYVWVNGHLLGRYWKIGPQQRLYCPQGWWKAGANEVLIFDQQQTHPAPIRGRVSLHV